MDTSTIHSVLGCGLTTLGLQLGSTKRPILLSLAVMHESGHGLYEQGLPRDYSFSPVGGAISLGVHEYKADFGKIKSVEQQHFGTQSCLVP